MLSRTLVIAVLALLLAPAAHAQKLGTNIRYSQLPYWEVGVLDPELSTLCANGRFNQLELYAFNYVFNGPVGPAVLGVATNAWNLSDPGHIAKAKSSYYFLRDRTTNCQVFRWGPGDTPKKQGAPSEFNNYKQQLEQTYQFRLVSPPSSPASGGSASNGQP